MFHRWYWSPRYAYACGDNYDDSRHDSAQSFRRRHRGRYRHGGYEMRGHAGRGGQFGVRRPLRYLSYQLDLDESQRHAVAAVLATLKVEREQQQIDRKKTVTALAGLVTKSDLSVEDLQSALAPRVASSETLAGVVAKAVHDIVAVLDDDQREEFAYLLSSGGLTL